MLEHGGRLRNASQRYGIPLSDWLDLSTGINPAGWPVPAVPAEAWARLPEDGDGLETVAASYFGCDSLLPVAGSQAAIQALPMLLHARQVGIIRPGYAEHAHGWRRAGHKVIGIAPEMLANGPGSVPWDILVAINPNNPTGHRFAPEVLLAWHERLAERGGWLVVDEAYMDPTPEFSLAPYCPRPGLIVLRSLGKFFGLAGARVGFLLAETDLLERMAALLGPWTVPGPSRWVAREALGDLRWQVAARESLPEASRRLAELLAGYGIKPAGGCALFQWCSGAKAAQKHESLARQGILTRRFADPPGLRLGLPGSDAAWERLATALRA